jgi:hypothetical protein
MILELNGGWQAQICLELLFLSTFTGANEDTRQNVTEKLANLSLGSENIGATTAQAKSQKSSCKRNCFELEGAVVSSVTLYFLICRQQFIQFFVN